MRYGIGLDVGITSVGYSVLELGIDDSPERIIRLGSRIFDMAENPKNGDSLAKPRREKRSVRRRLRRKRHRLERIRGLIVSSGLMSKEELEDLYNHPLSDIYELRVSALDKAVNGSELARIMINLAERRGFKSNRKSDSDPNSESGQLLKAINENASLCAEKGYRTVGEMLLKDEKFAETKRNKQDNYKNTVSRDAIEKEATLIFEAQRSFGNKLASEELQKKYLEILLSQRSFAEGPACGPYAGNQIEKMCGKCTFLPEEPRAAKAAYSFQIFSLWQDINHIRIRKKNGDILPLTDSQRHELFNIAHKKADLSYAVIRKNIDMEDDDVFVGLLYKKDNAAETEKKKKIKALEPFHVFRKTLDSIEKDYINKLDNEKLDCIGENLSKNYSDDTIVEKLTQAGIEDKAIQVLLGLPNMPKRGHISIKACRQIIPFLEQGLTYDKACESAGFDFKNEKNNQSFTLPALSDEEDEITNPVVKRAISQTIKVVNAIIREQNASPVYINIELAREMALKKKDRDEITKAQTENAEYNTAALKRLTEQVNEYFNTAPTGFDLVKFKLWEQQDGICPYSHEKIKISRLLEPGYVDVDHIVPYSKCFDDRMANKVLVLSKENREKGNRLPLEYLTGEKRAEFINWVESSSSIPLSKKNRLLMEHINNEGEWKVRNLVDTQYTSAFLARYITKHLSFEDFINGKKRHVTCVNGAITSNVRKRWGISKIRADGDLHHAVDATVIGCITQGMIHKLTNYSKYNECKFYNPELAIDEETGEVLDDLREFPEPWNGFRNELEIRLNSDQKVMKQMLYDWDPVNYREVDIEKVPAAFVSRMCDHKISGAAHLETAKSGKHIDAGFAIKKVKLNALKLKDGAIPNYYNPDSDRLLYEALIERLSKFGGDGKKAFEEPFYKPKANGEMGPQVKSVKIMESSSSSVSIYEGNAVADNATMVRVDVYYVENDGYYFVPIYVADTVKKELPRLAPTQVKDKNGNKVRKQMNENDFVFSLRKNDLISLHIVKPMSLSIVDSKSTLPSVKEISSPNDVLLYFDGLDISTATFAGVTHDNTYQKRGMGKTMPLIQKMEVDVLGNIRKVEKETIQCFKN